ncbi:MAG: AAA family ATPase [Verrucomicrobiota bacterium]
MKNRIINYIRAGYSGLYVVSHEEQRVEAEMLACLSDKKLSGFKLHAWSITEGIVSIDETPNAIAETEDPFAMLKQFDSMPEKTILLARDFHMILSDPNPMIFRKVKDSLLMAKSKNKVLVIVGCKLNLPAELEKEITILEYSLPDRAQLREVMKSVSASANVKVFEDIAETFIDAASGLTTTEAENAFALSIVEAREIVASFVSREKANTIKKNGLLEIVDSKVTLDDIGGLENLKQDLIEKKHSFTKAAHEYGIKTPRGALIVGQGGTGKSLTAQAAKNIFDLPLLRLEAGKLFGSLVGQSEGNWRSAFATAKAIAPCILWIDEVEGLFCGSQSSGQTDSGVTNRVIKAILQDMQFNSEGIYFVMTSNDIDGLPDPLIDRMDVWSVDLPNQSEREQIWKIHIAKRKRDPKKFDIAALAAKTDGFSGRQIEAIVDKALTLAFNDKGREPKNADFITATGRFVATSITMKEAIEKRRERLRNRATPASAPEAKQSASRKIVK